MSSALRLSIVIVLLLATAALGLMAYNAYLPKPVPQVVQVTPNAPAPSASGYFVAAHSLPVGTLARDEDFSVRSPPPDGIPSGAILDTPNAMAGLRGSLVRRFLDAGSPVTAQDVLRPRDRGFLANLLTPGSRAVTINVDAESVVSGLIRPGDYADVMLTQVNDRADPAHRSLSETVLSNVRIVAIDQEIVEGAQANNATDGRASHSVSLQLSPAQVKKIAIAKELGKLSLSIRSAVEQTDAGDAGTMFGCDVSPEIARESAIAGQSATVVVYAGGKAQEYAVRKNDAGNADAASGCDVAGESASRRAAVASLRAR